MDFCDALEKALRKDGLVALQDLTGNVQSLLSEFSRQA